MGSPGSGKSTVARILAKKLNKPSIDIDNDILEPMWGIKISEKVSSLNHEYVRYCLISVEVIKIGNCESIVLERLHPKFNVLHIQCQGYFCQITVKCHVFLCFNSAKRKRI